MSFIKGIAFYSGTKASGELKGKLLESMLGRYMHAKLGTYMKQRRMTAMMVRDFFYLTCNSVDANEPLCTVLSYSVGNSSGHQSAFMTSISTHCI